MATNDLMTELQKDSIKLDDDSERKVRGAFGFGGAVSSNLSQFVMR